MKFGLLKSPFIRAIAFASISTILAMIIVLLFGPEPAPVVTKADPVPEMVRIGSDKGPCGVTIHAEAVEYLEDGIRKWLVACNEAISIADPSHQ